MLSGNLPDVSTAIKEACSLTEKENIPGKTISEILILFRHFT